MVYFSQVATGLASRLRLKPKCAECMPIAPLCRHGAGISLEIETIQRTIDTALICCRRHGAGISLEIETILAPVLIGYGLQVATGLASRLRLKHAGKQISQDRKQCRHGAGISLEIETIGLRHFPFLLS